MHEVQAEQYTVSYPDRDLRAIADVFRALLTPIMSVKPKQ